MLRVWQLRLRFVKLFQFETASEKVVLPDGATTTLKLERFQIKLT